MATLCHFLPQATALHSSRGFQISSSFRIRNMSLSSRFDFRFYDHEFMSISATYGPVAQDYILQNLSSIADVVVQLVHGFAEVALEELGYLICKLIRGFHCTKVLGLSASLLEYLLPLVGQIECFHAPFCNLKSLRLYSGLNKFHFPVIVLLLKYSPNLEALDIEFCETSDSSYNWQPEDGAVECLAHCLKKVQIKGFQGWKIELEFVSFLLEHGRVLEELTITWLMDEDLQNVAMLSRLPRASSNLALKFLNE